jgi:hypothetical protein
VRLPELVGQCDGGAGVGAGLDHSKLSIAHCATNALAPMRFRNNRLTARTALTPVDVLFRSLAVVHDTPANVQIGVFASNARYDADDLKVPTGKLF